MKRILFSRGTCVYQFGGGFWRENKRVLLSDLALKEYHIGSQFVSTPCSFQRRYGHISSYQFPISEIRRTSFRTLMGGQNSRYQQDRGPRDVKQINNTIVEHGRKGDWRKILKIHQLHKEAFDFVNYSTALHQLVKIQSVDRKNLGIKSLLEGVASHLEKKPSEWSIRSKAMILHSVAKIRLDFPVARKVMNLILQDAVSIVEDGNATTIALTAWSVATTKLDCPRLFAAIDRHASHLVKTGNPRSVANTVWSFATMGIDCPQLLECIDQQAFGLVEHGDPQNIANTVWACAKLGTPCPSFFTAVDEQAERLVKDGSIQAITNTLWSFASLGLDCPRLAGAVCERAKDIVADGSPQAIANTAWSFAKMGIECQSLFAEIDGHASHLMKNGNPQAVANTVWSFATKGIDCPRLSNCIDQQAFNLVEHGNPQEVANTVWSFATMGIDCPQLLECIDQQAIDLVKQGIPQNIANIVWSFATLGVACPNLCRAVDLEANRLIQNGTSQDVASTFWSMSILGYDASGLFEAFGEREVDQFIKISNNQTIVNLCLAFAISGSLKRHSVTFSMLWKRAIEIDRSQLINEQRSQLIQTYLISSHVYSLQLDPPAWTSETITVDSHESISQREISKILD